MSCGILSKVLCDFDLLTKVYYETNPLIIYALWSLISILITIGFYLWREGPAYKKSNRIDGKVVIVTGCNTGIGREVALEMAQRGGRIYMACRDYEKCEKARREIIQITGNTEVFNRTLDLASLESVRDFASKFNRQEKHLDILVNNAGIMATPRWITVDGYEQQFAVNHLGHFLLTNLLLDKLKATASSRIVVVASIAHMWGRIQKEDINSEKSYNTFKVYGQSKLANILFTRKLAQKLEGSKVTVNCFHPGCVQSELSRYNILMKFFKFFFGYLLRSTNRGAQTALYLALNPELEGKSGGYYDRMRLKWLMAKAKDDKMADWLWRQSEKMVGLQMEEE